jgi:cytochrome c553
MGHKSHGAGAGLGGATIGHRAGSCRRQSSRSRPIGGGPRNLLGTGKRIYDEGIPEANIPACAACHGPDAKGQEAIPRLAGQLYAYTVKELTNWSRERGQGHRRAQPQALARIPGSPACLGR